jgi:hypothetical protein
MVGFTNRHRVVAGRRGVVVGKMTLIYEKGITKTNTTHGILELVLVLDEVTSVTTPSLLTVTDSK